MAKIQEGSCDESLIPKKSLGVLFYNRLKTDESDKILLVSNTYNTSLYYKKQTHFFNCSM